MSLCFSSHFSRKLPLGPLFCPPPYSAFFFSLFLPLFLLNSPLLCSCVFSSVPLLFFTSKKSSPPPVFPLCSPSRLLFFFSSTCVHRAAPPLPCRCVPCYLKAEKTPVWPCITFGKCINIEQSTEKKDREENKKWYARDKSSRKSRLIIGKIWSVLPT